MKRTLASKIRKAIFLIFSETNLPLINTNASSSEISRWKQKEEVSNCYKCLFEKIDNKENSLLILTRIISKVLHKNSSTVEMAFVIVICMGILDPKNGKLKFFIKDNETKNKILLSRLYNLFVLTINNIFYYLILFNFFLRIKLIMKSLWNLNKSENASGNFFRHKLA